MARYHWLRRLLLGVRIHNYRRDGCPQLANSQVVLVEVLTHPQARHEVLLSRLSDPIVVLKTTRQATKIRKRLENNRYTGKRRENDKQNENAESAEKQRRTREERTRWLPTQYRPSCSLGDYSAMDEGKSRFEDVSSCHGLVSKCYGRRSLLSLEVV